MKYKLIRRPWFLLPLLMLALACGQCEQRPVAKAAKYGGGSPADDPELPGDSASDGGPEDEDMCGPSNNKVIPDGMTGVYYGTRQPTYLPLTEAEIMAVVAISGLNSRDVFCSGLLITDDIVLTANHCVEGRRGDDLEIVFGVDDGQPVLTVPTEEKREHPDNDMALLRLSFPPADQISVTPIPILNESLTDAHLGATFEQAGYGRTESGRSDGRYFVAEYLDGFESQGRLLVVNGDGEHGVCYGDSGGPSMTLSSWGAPRVAGALSYGDPSCTDRDRYARVDYALEWIEEWTGPTPGADGEIPCRHITEVGICDANGQRLMRCVDGLLEIENCADGKVCGYSEEVQGWRCVAEEDDLCEGETYLGQCAEDGRLTWCDLGTVKTRDCPGCVELCTWVDAQIGNACMPDPCEGLDYSGECDGDTAVWCTRDQEIKQQDCTIENEVCRYLGPDQGYFCAVACEEGEDYWGRCEGNELIWCHRSGETRHRDCEARGQICAFVDDNTGHFCVDP